MNIVAALQFLGYKNGIDFTVDADNMDEISIWNHKDKKPTAAKLKKAWATAVHHRGVKPAKILPLRIPLPEPEEVVPEFTVDQLKELAIMTIEDRAEQTRLDFVTFGLGMGMVYQEKAEEAKDYIAEGCPKNLDSFPYIRAEVNVTGKQPKKVAEGILKAKSRWITASAKIEEIRLEGKQAVNRARSENGVNTAKDEALAKLDAV